MATQDATVEQQRLLPVTPLSIEYVDLSLKLIDVDGLVYLAPDKDLVENIKANGILEPLLVRGDGEKITLIEGRRRLEVARRLGYDTVPCMVVSGEASDDAIRLAAHGLRRHNPAMEVDAIERLLKRGFTESQISAATGLSVQTIVKRQRLLALLTTLREAFTAGAIRVSVAEAAASLPQSAQRRLVAKLQATGKLTAADIKEEKLARREAAQKGLDGLGLDDAFYEAPFDPLITEALSRAIDDAVKALLSGDQKAIAARLQGAFLAALGKEVDEDGEG